MMSMSLRTTIKDHAPKGYTLIGRISRKCVALLDDTILKIAALETEKH